jgi:hypothetical protein
VTDSNGVFRTDWFRNLSSGSYSANVVDLALTGYVWHSQLDLEDDDDTIAGPDDLLMF